MDNKQSADKKASAGFSSIYGFLMTAIGFAVGVGSLWRFPYVCGTNGGALFIIAYVAVIFIIGIPLLTAEMSMGYKTQKTAIHAYKELAPGKKWYLAGFLHLAAAQLIYSYTIPIYADILAYIYRTGSGFFSGMSPDQITASFMDLQGDFPQMCLFAIINWILVGLVVNKGLQGGIEKLSKILLPVLAVIMLVCIVIGLQVEGAYKGVLFLLQPNPQSFSFGSLIAALGQAFFAIGIAMLASMIFGSYLKGKNENIVKHASTISLAIIFAGLAAGFMIFPMVFAFGLEPAAGGALTLITLPNVFNYIAGGRIVGTLFYVGFYVAAFTSALGIMEAIVAVMIDTLNIKRSKAVLITMAVGLVIGVFSTANGAVFDLLDNVTSNYIIVLGALCISIFVGWIWGIHNFLEAANVRHPFIRIWLTVSVKYICPIAIIVIFLGNFITF